MGSLLRNPVNALTVFVVALPLISLLLFLLVRKRLPRLRRLLKIGLWFSAAGYFVALVLMVCDKVFAMPAIGWIPGSLLFTICPAVVVGVFTGNGFGGWLIITLLNGLAYWLVGTIIALVCLPFWKVKGKAKGKRSAKAASSR